jgi:hypothetical protein
MINHLKGRMNSNSIDLRNFMLLIAALFKYDKKITMATNVLQAIQPRPEPHPQLSIFAILGKVILF